MSARTWFVLLFGSTANIFVPGAVVLWSLVRRLAAAGYFLTSRFTSAAVAPTGTRTQDIGTPMRRWPAVIAT